MPPTLRRRGVAVGPSAAADTQELNANTSSPATSSISKTLNSAQWRAAAAAAVLLALLSAASEWNIYKQYESTVWAPLSSMAINLGMTAVAAVAVGCSPTARALKPGIASFKQGSFGEKKSSVLGIACVMLGVWLGFGFLGPCGLVTFAALAAGTTMLLP